MNEFEAIFDIETTEIEAVFQIESQVEALSELTDVTISDPVQDQFLIYNATSKVWENRTISFVFEQSASSAEWTINHNFGRSPSVTIVDSSGNIVEAEVTYVDDNTCIVQTNAPFKGKAILN